MAADNSKLSLSCPTLDKLLAGGLERGVLTLVYGPAAAGKTNLALQAALSAARKQQTVFVDTEGGFSAERVLQMCNGADNEIFKKIILVEPKNFAEQDVAIQRINQKQAGLIILDSLTALWRLELCDNKEKVRQINRQLARQLAALLQIAREKNIPILLTDQVYSSFSSYTKNFNSKNSSTSTKIELVGGDVPKYICKCIIRLEKLSRAKRKATIVKHRSIPEGAATLFEIKNSGLVGVEKKFKLF